MDFSLTEAQHDLAGLTRDILTGALTEQRRREIETGPDRFDRALWGLLAEAGVLSAALPVEAGGAGYGLLEQCAVLAELGRAVAPVPYLESITVAASTIAAFGTARQRDRWVRPAAAGELVLTAALAEDTGAEPTGAARSDGRWWLSGAKTTVPAGPFADVFLVPADTGQAGPAVFLVTPSDPGVTVRGQELVDGTGAAVLELDEVGLDDDRLLGEPGAGPRIADRLAALATIGLCAVQLGVAERALELTAEYARQRVQFDRPIGTFQAVAQRLADGYTDVEAIRLTLWQAAWRVADGLPAALETATAKFWAADAGHRVAHTAVHVHGGVGIDKEYPLHRYFVAAKRNEFSLGGATAQLRRIGSVLAAEPA
ncbi:MAG TPA: acyl-CoA dehydrogenase family protein [Actinophytocola sp.]|uniref:acyl-CoA dehydrogenase family protein n=1 Tax=Actinophytocola sp. TaxID=1872138 RepID=UPI002DBC5A3A|nr:acyl-CoA dehydrogenase family protein [Actinophytocola sp.]HEU5476088.1 acyl-CoA dehydrogenase family protein [Actinophytocola sp.]